MITGSRPIFWILLKEANLYLYDFMCVVNRLNIFAGGGGGGIPFQNHILYTTPSACLLKNGRTSFKCRQMFSALFAQPMGSLGLCIPVVTIYNVTGLSFLLGPVSRSHLA